MLYKSRMYIYFQLPDEGHKLTAQDPQWNRCHGVGVEKSEALRAWSSLAVQYKH